MGVQQDRQAEITKAIKRCSVELGLPQIRAQANGRGYWVCDGYRVPLRARDYQQWAQGKDVPGLPEIYSVIGGWSDASSQAGLGRTTGARPRTTQGEVQSALKAASQLWGKRPMGVSDYQELQGSHPDRVTVSLKPILKHYGTWGAACAANEITPRKEGKLVKDQRWLDELQAISADPLSIREFNRAKPAGFPSAQRLGNLWGGWARLRDEVWEAS
jgi:hypothetical protein